MPEGASRLVRAVAVLMALALGGRILVAPVHLWQEQYEEQCEHSAPGHDHSTEHHHDPDSCSVCQDLFLTKHVGPGPALTAPIVQRIDLPAVLLPLSRDTGSFSLATGGARGPPTA